MLLTASYRLVLTAESHPMEGVGPAVVVEMILDVSKWVGMVSEPRGRGELGQSFLRKGGAMTRFDVEDGMLR
jgi:hypothetical protein